MRIVGPIRALVFTALTACSLVGCGQEEQTDASVGRPEGAVSEATPPSASQAPTGEATAPAEDDQSDRPTTVVPDY